MNQNPYESPKNDEATENQPTDSTEVYGGWRSQSTIDRCAAR
jgi:hypothetical protein